MKAVVEEILAAEKRAGATLDEARKRALELQQESDKVAASLIAAAHDKAQQLLRERATAARSSAKTTRDTALLQAESANLRLIEQNRDNITALVDAITSMVMAPLPPSEKK